MQYKKVLIFGYKKSGQSVENLLLKNNIKYAIYDKNEYKKNDARFIAKLNKNVLSQFDLVVVSPGVSVYSKDIIKIKKLGIKIVGETEFASRYTIAPIIAVTGTNGKTTTTNLITHILDTKYKVRALGNVGTPLSLAVGENLDYIVNEISSFQLETIDKYKPNINVLLNIDIDHLDWHKTKSNYINAKLNLFKNNTLKSISIVNVDDDNIKAYIPNIKGKIYTISIKDKNAKVYVEGDYIVYNYKGKGKIDVHNLKQNINIYNLMASVMVAKILGIEDSTISKCFSSFKVDEHRLEVVKIADGITYIDDSKSTNPHSTINALNSVDSNSVILLLGGYDKGLDMADIFKNCAHKLKAVVAMGKCRKKVQKCAKKCGYQSVVVKKDFALAVYAAMGLAESGDTVLLSPATSSFDQFSSYAARGELFKNIVSQVEDIAKNK